MLDHVHAKLSFLPFPMGAAVPKAVLRVRRSSREQLDVRAIEHSEAHRVRRMSKEQDLATPSTTEALRCGRQPRELLDLRRAGSAQVSSSPTRTDRRACLYPNQSIPASPAPTSSCCHTVHRSPPQRTNKRQPLPPYRRRCPSIVLRP